MTQSTLLSVIVCTRNRVDELATCLPLLAEQAAKFTDVEVVVVDNGSTDGTRSLVEKISSEPGSPVRYAYEPEAGLCRARNRGRAAAAGRVIAYVDDDIVVAPDWIERIRDHFNEGRSDILAGRVRAEPEGELPNWLPGDLLWVLGESRLGDEPRALHFPQHPQGGNFAVRVEVFDAAGGFNPLITLYGDETDFFRRVSAGGFTTFYDPEVVVTQRVPVQRLTQKELGTKAYKWGRGAAMVYLLSSPGAGRRWLKAAEYLLRAAYVGGRWCVGPRFGRYFTFWHNCGYVWQLVHGNS